jgi:hypothetical protein
MSSVQSPRRRTVIMTALAGTLLAARPGVAQSPMDAGTPEQATPASDAGRTGPGFAAVPAKHTQIANVRIGLEYFQTPKDAPEQLSDGGVRQYFSGPLGEGAIYWSARTGAHYTYGSLLTFLEDERAQNDRFYPLNDPQTGPGDGCPRADVVKRQAFTWIMPPTRPDGRVATVTIQACVGPDGMAYRGLSHAI